MHSAAVFWCICDIERDTQGENMKGELIQVIAKESMLIFSEFTNI